MHDTGGTAAGPRPESTLTAVRHRFERLLEVVVLLLVTSLALVVVVGVGFRKIGAALVWYDEVASVLLAWLTYYGAALAALRRAHIGFPNVVQALGDRWRVPVILLGEAIVIGFFVVAAWAGWQVLVILAGSSLVSLPAVPTRLTQSVIPVGAVLFVVAQLLSLPEILRGEVPDAATLGPAGSVAAGSAEPGPSGRPPGESGDEAPAEDGAGHPEEDGGGRR